MIGFSRKDQAARGPPPDGPADVVKQPLTSKRTLPKEGP